MSTLAISKVLCREKRGSQRFLHQQKHRGWWTRTVLTEEASLLPGVLREQQGKVGAASDGQELLPSESSKAAAFPKLKQPSEGRSLTPGGSPSAVAPHTYNSLTGGPHPRGNRVRVPTSRVRPTMEGKMECEVKYTPPLLNLGCWSENKKRTSPT